MKHVLLVEPDALAAGILRRRIRHVAHVSGHAAFAAARRALEARPFDFIVSNLRLHTHNGLQLVYLASSQDTGVRGIVYTEHNEPSMAREVQCAGAFYETRRRLVHALVAYLEGTLPSHDRRDASVRDRRAAFRGGRRRSDRETLHLASNRMVHLVRELGHSIKG